MTNEKLTAIIERINGANTVRFARRAAVKAARKDPQIYHTARQLLNSKNGKVTFAAMLEDIAADKKDKFNKALRRCSGLESFLWMLVYGAVKEQCQKEIEKLKMEKMRIKTEIDRQKKAEQEQQRQQERQQKKAALFARFKAAFVPAFCTLAGVLLGKAF